MSRRVLVIGDVKGDMRRAVEESGNSEVVSAGTVFDGIAELAANPSTYAAVVAASEPIERRPEAAVRQLRELAGKSARVVLFGNATLEPLSRKMLAFGVDDYVVTPATAGDLKISLKGAAAAKPSGPAVVSRQVDAEAVVRTVALDRVEVGEIALEAMLQQPGDATGAAVRAINRNLPPGHLVVYAKGGVEAEAGPAGTVRLSQSLGEEQGKSDCIYLYVPRDGEGAGAHAFLARVSSALGKLGSLQSRHDRLQKLAITDDLTGLYNGRYFRHFLAKILEASRTRLSPVTLFIFDIDNFKHYNDQFGHAVGDEILKQTAMLMKRCVREHDHVARIGGDEFAVVFWEKDAPRQPHHEGAGAPGRPPTTPDIMLQRFQTMLASQDLTLLGAAGKGTLTISGGLAVFPYQAQTAEGLIQLADERLMFGAKKGGKNSIALVGGETPWH